MTRSRLAAGLLAVGLLLLAAHPAPAQQRRGGYGGARPAQFGNSRPSYPFGTFGSPQFSPGFGSPTFGRNAGTPLFAPNFGTPLFRPNFGTPLFSPSFGSPSFGPFR
jgi:hypothetical protein